jgi:hypothetical protein
MRQLKVLRIGLVILQIMAAITVTANAGVAGLFHSHGVIDMVGSQPQSY